jgi:hypothetical protein
VSETLPSPAIVFDAGVNGLPPSFRAPPSCPNHWVQASITFVCSSSVSGIEPPR